MPPVVHPLRQRDRCVLQGDSLWVGARVGRRVRCRAGALSSSLRSVPARACSRLRRWVHQFSRHACSSLPARHAIQDGAAGRRSAVRVGRHGRLRGGRLVAEAHRSQEGVPGRADARAACRRFAAAVERATTERIAAGELGGGWFSPPPTSPPARSPVRRGGVAVAVESAISGESLSSPALPNCLVLRWGSPHPVWHLPFPERNCRCNLEIDSSPAG